MVRGTDVTFAPTSMQTCSRYSSCKGLQYCALALPFQKAEPNLSMSYRRPPGRPRSSGARRRSLPWPRPPSPQEQPRRRAKTDQPRRRPRGLPRRRRWKDGRSRTQGNSTNKTDGIESKLDSRALYGTVLKAKKSGNFFPTR